MGLQVWLPLDGNLENQGLNGGLVPTLMGTGITYSAGKIGQAATFPNNCNSCIHMNGLKLQTFTWSCWINVSGEGSGFTQYFMSEGRDTGSIGTNLLVSKEGTTLKWATHKKTGSTTIALNTWYHVALTADGTNIRFYLNGQLKSTTAYTENSDYAQSANKLVLGKMSYNYTSTGSYFPFNGKLNDVRIYDNALSDKEVEVLARGLVLHYPLDREGFGQDNMLKSTPKSADPSAYNFIQLDLTSNLQANTTYTLQLWDVNVSHSGKNDSQLGVSVYWGGGSVTLCNLLGNTYFTNGHADYLVSTFTITEAQANHSQAVNAWLNIYNSVPNATGTRNGTIGRWKLEIGDKATPWTPALTDDLYSGMGLDSNIVYDATGYKRNGTANGVTCSGDTAKYLTSTSFDGIDDGITLPDFEIGNIFNNSCTISFWIKPNGENGARSVYLGAYSQTSWNIEKTASNTLRSYWNNSPNLNITEIVIEDDSWQHIAIAKNGTSSLKFYYNGELKKEATNVHSALTFGTPWRIGRDRRENDGTQYKGLMSDFRIYATALSAEAIAELYHTGASLADNGTLMTSQYVEV